MKAWLTTSHIDASCELWLYKPIWDKKHELWRPDGRRLMLWERAFVGLAWQDMDDLPRPTAETEPLEVEIRVARKAKKGTH